MADSKELASLNDSEINPADNSQLKAEDNVDDSATKQLVGDSVVVEQQEYKIPADDANTIETVAEENVISCSNNEGNGADEGMHVEKDGELKFEEDNNVPKVNDGVAVKLVDDNDDHKRSSGDSEKAEEIDDDNNAQKNVDGVVDSVEDVNNGVSSNVENVNNAQMGIGGNAETVENVNDVRNGSGGYVETVENVNNVQNGTGGGSAEKVEDYVKSGVSKMDLSPNEQQKITKDFSNSDHEMIMTTPRSFLGDSSVIDGYESGTEEEQVAFAKDVEKFYRENHLEYKPPRFYKETLNLLKLWRLVIKMGGYEQVTSCKFWRQVGESFRPPKTCTTVSWTFRIFYEKSLLEYEKNKMRNGELPFSDCPLSEPIRAENQALVSQGLSAGRARRDSAARAMEGWHSQRVLDNGQVCQPIVKDRNMNSTLKVDNKQLKTNGLLKRKGPLSDERPLLVPHMRAMKSQSNSMVIDVGPPADWVKINVQRTTDCFEIYALVPGLLREEVHVQSDPAGRLIISGNPEHLDNPWGVTPFKKVVSLPSRIDPHQTSAVVTLHGQLFVRVPFEATDI